MLATAYLAPSLTLAQYNGQQTGYLILNVDFASQEEAEAGTYEAMHACHAVPGPCKRSAPSIIAFPLRLVCLLLGMVPLGMVPLGCCMAQLHAMVPVGNRLPVWRSFIPTLCMFSGRRCQPWQS